MSKYKHNYDCPFEAFVTDLGKYNEGELVGEWVKFPSTKENLNNAFKRIGICPKYKNNGNDKEWFIADYDIYVEGINANALGKYANFKSLNYLATIIKAMDEQELRKFSAVLEDDNYSSTLNDLIYVAEKLDSFEVLFNIKSESELGHYYINNDCFCNENITNYIDYERLGRDLALQEAGTFTKKGYVVERN